MNLWTKLYAAKRRASDRALLASLEREIANEEKLRASPQWSKLKRPITAIEMLTYPEAQEEAMYGDVNRITADDAPDLSTPEYQAKFAATPVDESERARIARAFGRPL